ncbi:DUF6664 family protein [Faecalimonas sp.]
MRIDNIDIYHLPKWLEGIFEDIESLCHKTLKKESEAYRKILNQTDDLLEKYRVISTIVDGDKINESLELSVEEAEALSRFCHLESDRKDMETIQIYLMGAKHMWELMELLKLAK